MLNKYLVATDRGVWDCIDENGEWEILQEWVDPQNPEHMILGPADGVDRGGRIERSRDGGYTWEDVSLGMITPWQGYMIERFYQYENRLLAVLSNGDLIGADLDELRWRTLISSTERINAVISFC